MHISREELEWLLRNIALGFSKYASVNEKLDSIEELLRNPPVLYESDFSVLDVGSSQVDAVFLRGIDQHGVIAVSAELEPDERNVALARELLSALITSEHGRALGLRDFLMPYLDEAAQYFAQHLVTYFHMTGTGIQRDGDLRGLAKKLSGPAPIRSLSRKPNELEAFFRARFGSYFVRSEVRQQAANYLQGLLKQGKRRTGRQIAKGMGDRRPQAVQRLLYGASWDEEAVRDEMQRFIIEKSGDEEGIAVLDEISYLKRGSKTVGVQRQYSKSTGRVENCQIGVFLAFTASKRCTFLDRRLYLPEEWAMDQGRRAEVKVPEGIRYSTKPDLALEMLQHAWVNGAPIRWVVGDEPYGDHADLRELISSKSCLYVLGVSSDTPVRTVESLKRGRGLPKTGLPFVPGKAIAKTVANLVAGWSDQKWKRLIIGDGAGGVHIYDWARTRVVENRDGSPEAEVWLLAQRMVRQRSEIVYFFSNASSDASLQTLARMASARSMFDRIVKEAQRETGLNDYEVRHWRSWHRYITLSMIAHTWLTLGREL
jgi:SRSO17 transposase